MTDDFIGDRYQRLTMYFRDKAALGGRPAKRPSAFKEYPGSRTVSLEGASIPEGGLWEALFSRRSRRTFTADPISLETLSRLVFAAQGVTARAGDIALRTAPSAGALYPIETYVLANRVEAVDPGLYHYNILRASLELIKEGNLGGSLAEAALGQGMCERAAAVFIWTSVMDRCKIKYAQRAYRYMYLDAGHVCENLYLAAEDLGLGCCGIGAFFDEEVNALLGVDAEEETTVYLAPVGPVKEKTR